MTTITPKTWEGRIKLIQKKEGSDVFTLQPHSAGKYGAENLDALIKAIIAAKVKLDGWKVWLDGAFDAKLDKGADVTPTLLAKIVKEADDVQLAFVKRPFPQPKLRFVKGEGAAPARKAKATLREL